MVKKLFVTLWLLPRRIAIGMIDVYQHTLSPDHGPLKHVYTYGYCRHEPTCSMYGKNVIVKRGLVIGSVLLLGRILTCHPWKKLSDEKIKMLIAKKG